ncbi:arylesterase [Thiorhodococcus mannitoliphagus]|uniref:Arylesterase n=1 Tax=Thiorhodococcus mannitoliphagus TaxID=329406 RepID=A0A6P1DWB0_9GAMM|nr:GDSL-type esterase/lipase family protein [Thiorhodococcus mannitoliphagus]NEX20402.1 arylesterase [Thiorhodococcus mannitoliphagus]
MKQPSRPVSTKPRQVLGILLLLITLVLQGCESPRLSTIPPDGTLLAFGDSLTQGVGVNPPDSYPSVLERLSGRRVINAGVSGEETEDGLPRLRDLLARTTPDLLLLLEGGNDILRNRDLKATKRNLAAMIELAEEQGVEVVLIGVPEKRLFSTTAPLYKELAEEYDLVFEDDLVAQLMRQGAYKSDAIHFNQEGYRLMAESLHDLLVEEGAL